MLVKGAPEIWSKSVEILINSLKEISQTALGLWISYKLCFQVLDYCHQATNDICNIVDQAQCYYMASLGHNGLICSLAAHNALCLQLKFCSEYIVLKINRLLF